METHALTPLLSSDQQPIVALATPQGSGAIAVIRVCGEGAIEVTDTAARLSSKKLLSELTANTIHHGHVVEPSTEEIVDEVLFFLMRAPRTFTGQDTVEISCHNNPFIINRIIDLLIHGGARPAKAGEFTMRAYLNGKIDLLQAESINEVIHAPSEQALQRSMAQLQGSLSQRFVAIETGLIEVLTLCEASFEFLEEEQRDFSFDELVLGKITALRMTIAEVLTSFNQQTQIKEGIRIALIGSVNAGKSSLFNLLVGKNRAIVADIAGTTRDSIETVLYKQGHFWLVIDTAGLRQTGDTIEQQGIARSYEEAQRADIILLVIDSGRIMTAEETAIYERLYAENRSKTIVVLNKIDSLCQEFMLPAALGDTAALCRISTRTKTGEAELDTAIRSLIDTLFTQRASPFMLNQRQHKLITEIDKNLNTIEKSFSNCIQYELMAYQCKDLLEKVGQLTGKQISEEILDSVFSKFCVGK